MTESQRGLSVGVEVSSSGPIGPPAIGSSPEGQGLFVLVESLTLFNCVYILLI